MEILDGLNPEQRLAATHKDGPMLVLAGAGTGKTQVITRRIAYLIAEKQAQPHEVLALTFTEKAAREMEERLYDLIGWQSFQVPVMTFHAFGTELLGRFAAHIGRSIRGGLINDTQKALLLEQHLDRLKFGYYGPQDDEHEFLKGIVDYIGQLQNASISPEEYWRYVMHLSGNPPEEMHPKDIEEQLDLASLYKLYDQLKVETGTFDYNDQIELPLRILRERPNLAERLAREYRYVLVDEYQDTNSVQDALLRVFIPRTGNLFVVGDDDQAIYGFRGADISNILQFSQHFDVKNPIVLIRNYRSGQGILDKAHSLIAHNNPERLEAKLGVDKRLRSQVAQGTAAFRSYATSNDELLAVLKDIKALEAGGQPLSSIAVLATTHMPLRLMAKILQRHGLAYNMAATVNIFEQPEILSLWYLLRWIAMQADDEAIGHVIMGTFIGWAPDSLRQLLERCRDNLTTLEAQLRLDASQDSDALCRRLDEWREWARQYSISELAFKLVFETGVSDSWRLEAETKPRMVRVFEDLQKLLDHMQDFESISTDASLGSYVRAFPNPPVLEVSEPAGDAGGVQLLTVHSSKGLEFDVVFLINCTHRAWSSTRAAQGKLPEVLSPSLVLPPEHEYRRLMYVAVTRAKKALYVSAPAFSMNGAKLATSPFVSELFEGETLPLFTKEQQAAKFAAINKVEALFPLKSDIVNLASSRLQDTDGWLDINVTDLSAYDFCPFEFFLRTVLQIKYPLGPQVSFGNVLHKVFERYYKARMAGLVVSSSELHGLLAELWSDRGYERKSLAQADLQLAQDTLDKFIDREEHASRSVVASEMPIRFEIPEAKLRIRGKIDAIFTTGGGVEIRDFKTGRTKTDAVKLSRDAKDNFQLRTYALAYELLNGNVPDFVTLDYVVTGVEGSAELSSTILKNHRQKMIEIASKIRNQEFSPNPSPVHVCSAIKYYGTGERDELLQSTLSEAKES